MHVDGFPDQCSSQSCRKTVPTKRARRVRARRARRARTRLV
jgi:hypothetical protein